MRYRPPRGDACLVAVSLTCALLLNIGCREAGDAAGRRGTNEIPLVAKVMAIPTPDPADIESMCLSDEEIIEEAKRFCIAIYGEEPDDIRMGSERTLDDDLAAGIDCYHPEIVQYLKVTYSASKRAYTLGVDRLTGVVVHSSLYSSPRFYSVADSAVAATPLTKEEAFRAAAPIFRYYGLDLDGRQYRMKYEDTGVGKDWVVVRPLRCLNGVPCRISGVKAIVSCIKGTVEFHFGYVLVAPSTLKINVPKESARAVAQHLIDEVIEEGRSGQTFELSSDLDSIELVISPPMPYEPLGIHYRELGLSPMERFYCWAIPMTVCRGDQCSDLFIFVDVDRGAVVSAGAVFNPFLKYEAVE